MFPQQPQQQFRNSNADVQIFYGSTVSTNVIQSWNKPKGVSHIYMLLIGPGGNGDGITGGGTGAVTVWYGAAQHVPDSLILDIAKPSATSVKYRTTSSAPSTLLAAEAGGMGTADVPGAAWAANSFANSGFFQSVAGQTGVAGSPTASSTTFLGAGGAVTTGTQTSNYGYSLGGVSTANRDGFLLLQPLIVGAGGMKTGKGGIGCGGGGSGGNGGPGMILIASW